MSSSKNLIIPEDRVGQRIDNFLLSKLKKVSRPRIYKMLRKGEVRVNKGRIKPGYKLCVGDEIRLPPAHTYESAQIDDRSVKNIKKYKSKAEEILKNAILYEDDRLIIINKVAGVAVHGGSGLSYGLIELMREHWSHYHQLELVHRLDKDTSGCLLVAKKRSMLRALHAMLREREIHKYYHALVKGNFFGEKEVDLPLKKFHLATGGRIVKVDYAEGAPALTKFKALKNYAGDITLLQAEPVTGKTHQIRVHAAESGLPIAGDDYYGDRQFNLVMKRRGLKRMFLHAHKLEFECPLTHKLIAVEAAYDNELKDILNSID